MAFVAKYLDTLNDCELCFLYTYKYRDYLDESKTYVDAALRNRGLDHTHIKQYISKVTFNPENTGCPRCDSHRYLDNGVQCAICGYDIRAEDQRKKSTGRKILDFFGDLLGNT